MNKLLLTDDDVELAGMLKEYLQQEGFDVTVAHDGVTAEQYVLAGNFDLMILDVMMPIQDGIQTLRNIRANSSIPVIMLTAKGDNNDKITGLELGADDYVPKPCTPRELVARVRAILRRIQSNTSRTYVITVGDLKVLSSQRRAEWQNHMLDLTSTEFNLLEILARHAGAVVSKEELSLQALGRPLAKFDRSIDVHLSSIRQKIAQYSDNPNVIQTVYRMGYQLLKE
ncbi:response regulator with CheY-like receiver domain and winged-helix DNA-binding domain [Methylophilaceae bacterium 11]|jgi:two-component system response regulator CpxR|uniref:response regulator transcription factor n=1 Tax=unclassified Methylotenera TaxID=2643294 RepID=UPI00035DE57D|nr:MULTISPECIES: response regulator transcription factor [unclassified Methylotenera]EUJ10759.1 response regulator with CheY-like receiver domain and winged-helix DNA-binding domain [Methylophilaceae bacterium 11]